MKTANCSVFVLVSDWVKNEGASLSSHIREDNMKFSVTFDKTSDFLGQLANKMAENYDIREDYFLEYVTNEIENNRFDYNQLETSDSYYIDDEEAYKGKMFLVDYSVTVTVFEEVEYNF